jgi:peptide deformylase
MIREIEKASVSLTARECCHPVATGEDVSHIVQDLWDTIKAPRTDKLHALGLAANQIGYVLRVAAINAPGEELTLVNPEIVKAKGSAWGEEMCFSLPGVKIQVQRATTIKVRTANHPNLLRFVDMTARIVQHEIDHLDGLLIDRFLKEKP